MTLVPIYNNLKEYAEKNNLDCIKIRNAIGNKTDTIPSQYCIARHILVKDIINNLQIPNIDIIEKETNEILNKISDMYISDAGGYLSSYPRIDKYGNEIESNKEKPEVAVIEGVLFGFNNCCIEYYIYSRYYDKSKEYRNKNTLYIPFYTHCKENIYIGCDECRSKLN